MPLYEYYCKPCATQFEVLRPMSKMDASAICPAGHTTNNRVISLFATISNTSDSAPSGQPAGGCCAGGSCACSAGP
jgi:putative FmdB family regulatory protein